MTANDPARRVAEALKAPLGRSELYVWLWDHYDDLSAAKSSPGARANWRRAAAEVSRLGIKTRDGKPITPETLRRTFARVDADAKRLGRGGPNHAESATPTETQSGLESVTHTVTEAVQPEPVMPPRRFQFGGKTPTPNSLQRKTDG
jgi:integrase